MADPNASPISQLLQSMGMTREDLNQRSIEMRQFLNVNDTMASRGTDFAPAGYRSRSSSDLRSGTRSSSSSISVARSLSRASSNSVRDLSPPAAPVKTEPFESGPSLLQPRDNMEAVIERQRQSRKERKTKRERERAGAASRSFAPPSPSPIRTASQPPVSLDKFMHSRDEVPQVAEGSSATTASTSAETQAVAAAVPVTPQKSKYYREHTMDSASSQPRKDTACKTETPTPTRLLPQQSIPPPAYYAYPTYMAAYPHYLPVHQEQPPVTPQKSQLQPSLPGNTPTPTQNSIAKMPSPLPPSSPFPAQSSPPPSSSPAAPRMLNQVSSPGPMEPLPDEDQYDKLPFKLPPGPYSPNKPDLSYAALVGQAILSSAEHRLTLQEIYDFITIVYPHYKRGETTWMNSIRHVLSTTAVFRKVPRDRSIGRTLWAIFDEDIECFKGGGFRKHLCKDIMSQQKEKAKKTNSRKRAEADDGSSNDTRRSKRARKDTGHYASSSSTNAASSRAGIPAHMSAPVTVMGPPQPAFMAAHPYFPRPTQHQPYYESCMSQAQPQMLPAEIIFPPLPADAALRTAPRLIRPPLTLSTAPSTSSATSASSPPLSSPPSTIEKSLSSDASIMDEDMDEPHPSSSSSLESVPELSPNRSSSTSPPSAAPATSDMDVEIHDVRGNGKAKSTDGGVAIAGLNGLQGEDESGSSTISRDDDEVFGSSLLGPVHFWGDSPNTARLLAPSIELINFDAMTDDEDGYVIPKDKKGKGKASTRKGPAPPDFPSSPTLAVRSNLAGSSEAQDLSALKSHLIDRPKTPTRSTPSASSSALPSTPPQQRLKLSSTRTPISHKGLTMSPSASLAHYKSNLDPPPVVYQAGAHKLLSSYPNIQYEGDALDELLRTPRKSSSSSKDNSSAGPSTSALSLLGPPVTPKRGGLFDSPFRSGLSGGLGLSPFRTPRSRDIYDPHDPRALLDEELNRPVLGADSPIGIFGKRSALLYDSPGPDPWGSPGKRWYW